MSSPSPRRVRGIDGPGNGAVEHPEDTAITGPVAAGPLEVVVASSPLHRAAGPASFAVAVGGVLYSVLFVIAVKSGSSAAATASWLVLLLVALLTSAVLVVVYRLVREADAPTSLWALVLAAAGTYGSIAHAGYAVASEKNRTTDVVSQADPRGLSAFGLTGLALLAFGVVIRRAGVFPAGLGTLGLVFGVLLVLTYLGRLIVVDPNNVGLLGVAAVTGLIVHPWWWSWLGLSLRRFDALTAPRDV
jgi:hypothetical protein